MQTSFPLRSSLLILRWLFSGLHICVLSSVCSRSTHFYFKNVHWVHLLQGHQCLGIAGQMGLHPRWPLLDLGSVFLQSWWRPIFVGFPPRSLCSSYSSQCVPHAWWQFGGTEFTVCGHGEVSQTDGFGLLQGTQSASSLSSCPPLLSLKSQLSPSVWLSPELLSSFSIDVTRKLQCPETPVCSLTLPWEPSTLLLSAQSSWFSFLPEHSMKMRTFHQPCSSQCLERLPPDMWGVLRPHLGCSE